MKISSCTILFLISVFGLLGCASDWVAVRSISEDAKIVDIGAAKLRNYGYQVPADPYPYAMRIIEDESKKQGFCPGGFVVSRRMPDLQGGAIGYEIGCKKKLRP